MLVWCDQVIVFPRKEVKVGSVKGIELEKMGQWNFLQTDLELKYHNAKTERL